MKEIIQAIVEAEERYGCDYVDVIIDYNYREEEKVFIMYHDSHNSFAIKVFDYTKQINADELEDLCDGLNLGFDYYL